MLWLFGIGLVTSAIAAISTQTPKSKFSCDGRTSGYYADVQSGCQVYHMCDGLGRQFSYTCPNATLFQQRMLICDHWYMVNCSKSESDYGANLRIGQRGMPFVDDSESNPYHRTPRPDLLSHPSQLEYDIIYRTGRTQYGSKANVVGAETDDTNSTTSTTDQPAYSLPSHWSTQYSLQSTTTTRPINRQKALNLGGKTSNFDHSNAIKDVPLKPSNAQITESAIVNYKSYYKNTTPVFPKSVEPTTEKPDSLGILPPLPYKGFGQKFGETQNHINFQSNFKATTPVYPTSVESTSAEPGDIGILPPVATKSIDPVVPVLNVEFEPPSIENVNRSDDIMEVTTPSKFYQPPKFVPDYTDDVMGKQEQVKKGGFKALNNEEWEDLRKKFFIPDYEFPLETVSRPGYDSVVSSFQVNPIPSRKK